MNATTQEEADHHAGGPYRPVLWDIVTLMLGLAYAIVGALYTWLAQVVTASENRGTWARRNKARKAAAKKVEDEIEAFRKASL